jgi:hypothetical protein
MESEKNLHRNKYITSIISKDIPEFQKQQFKNFYKQKSLSENVDEKKGKTSTVVTSQEEPGLIKFEKLGMISIDSKDRDTFIYPRQNNFRAFLGKTFYNVKKIELISTEIPNTDQVITNFPPEIQNNILSWENKEDYDLGYFKNLNFFTQVDDTVTVTWSDHGYTIDSSIIVTVYNSRFISETSISGVIDGKYNVTFDTENTFRILYDGGVPEQGVLDLDIGKPKYFVEVQPGSYTAKTLTKQMQKSLRLEKRRGGIGQFHYYDVDVSLDTDVMTFDSVLTKQLGSGALSTTASSNIITVSSIAHGFKTGDRVKMINVRTLAGITGTILSGNFIIKVLDFNTFTYEVNERAIETAEGGGNRIQTGQDSPFKFTLDTENTLIQFNTGFANEDSSEYIGAENPITTKILDVSALSIEGKFIRITTDTPHGLFQSNVIEISEITTGYPSKITTATPHLISVPIIINLVDTNCVPTLNRTLNAIPSGPNTFFVEENVKVAGNSGVLIYGGDTVAVSGIKTTPDIQRVPSFFVENITDPYTFDIRFFASNLDQSSVDTGIVRTEQVFIHHPNHKFNQISRITPSGSNFAILKTLIEHNFVGGYNENSNVVLGPVGTNTIDITYTNHGLSVSDEVTLTQSTTNPSVNGTYKIQIVDLDTFRINFVVSSITAGTVIVAFGDIINISSSNSLPRIDGFYRAQNRFAITGITTGTTSVSITTVQDNDWEIGDTVTLSGTNCSPPLDGDFTIFGVVNPGTFAILVDFPIVNSGNTGAAINRNEMRIKTNFEIITPGTSAVLGRDLSVIHYRIEAETLTGDNLGGIDMRYLNGVRKEIFKLIDKDNYMVRSGGSHATKAISKGGSNVRVSSEIHGYRPVQGNTDTGDDKGELFRSISLEGEKYLFLQVSNLETITTNSSNIKNVFAKLLLDQSPGFMIFNSFVSAPKEFDHPIPSISSLDLNIITSKGIRFNFNDIDFSLTLRITEIIEQTDNMNVNSRSRKAFAPINY